MCRSLITFSPASSARAKSGPSPGCEDRARVCVAVERERLAQHDPAGAGEEVRIDVRDAERPRGGAVRLTAGDTVGTLTRWRGGRRT